jgi:hypothetical protein
LKSLNWENSTKNNTFDHLISLNEASHFSGLSSDHLRRLMEKGLITGKKIGRDWVTTKKYVMEYIKQDNHPGRKPK